MRQYTTTSTSRMPEFYPESDANTLANAHAIHAHPQRHKAARDAAKKLAKTAKDKAAGMSAVASGKRPGIEAMDQVFDKHYGPKGKVTRAMQR